MCQPRLQDETELMAWLDEAADRFEQAWRCCRPPNIADVLADALARQPGFKDASETSPRLALLRELIKLDIAYRGRLGDKRQVGDYLSEFPELTEDTRAQDGGVSGEGECQAKPWRVGDYEVLEELGQGGMGVVYKARQISLNRIVALKMIVPGLYTGSKQRARFRTEVEAAARVRHPNIVQIYQVGEHDGRPFCALEYVAGTTLGQHLAGNPQPPAAAARLVETLARALQHAHDQGIIHRDLKPANILLEGKESPMSAAKIADFGLAKHLSAEGEAAPGDYQTHTGEVLGTPSYMAPEQAEGKIRQIGRASDVYSLGAILYEMLTGRPPFRGETMLDTLEQVRTQEPVSPSRLQPKLPRDLTTICLKALSKLPARRYTTAAELADDLKRFLEGKPIQARPAARIEKLWRWCRRNPVVAALLGAVALVVLAGTTVSLFFAIEARNRQKAAEKHKRTADRRLYISDMRLAQRAWEEKQIGWFLDLLDWHSPQAGREDLRAFEWHYWRRRFDNCRLTLRGHRGGVSDVAFSPNGQWLASAGEDGTVRLWDSVSGRQIRCLENGADAVSSIAFSPNGRKLASAHADGNVAIWDATTGEAKQTLNTHARSVGVVAFASDSRRLAAGCSDGTVQVWDINAGDEPLILKGHTNAVHGLAFNPDARRLISCSADGTAKMWDLARGESVYDLNGVGSIRNVAFSPDGRRFATASPGRIIIWDAASAKQVQTLQGHPTWILSLAFSPDGRRLVADHDWTVAIWDLASSRVTRTLVGHKGSVIGVAFDPGGRRIASASGDGTVKVWDESSGAEALTLRGHTLHVHGVAFSPDGKQVASAAGESKRSAGEVKVWDLAGGREPRCLVGHEGGVNGVAFSPDGKHLASAGDDRTVRIWSSSNGRELLKLQGHTDKVWMAAFRPDGRRLASAGEDQTIRIYDADTGQELLTIPDDGKLSCVAYSPDGRRLATADWLHTVKVWDADTGQMLLTLRGHTQSVWWVAFSPDSRRVASCGNDRTVRIWDLTDGRELHTLMGHVDKVSGVAFAPDGRRLASAGWDGTVKLWDDVSGQETLTLKGHSAQVFGVTFSPDGRKLASASWDQTVKIWNATPLPDADR